MDYKCTVFGGGLIKHVDKVAGLANDQMAAMAKEGWRLVSASSYGNVNPIFLFWERA